MWPHIMVWALTGQALMAPRTRSCAFLKQRSNPGRKKGPAALHRKKGIGPAGRWLRRTDARRRFSYRSVLVVVLRRLVSIHSPTFKITIAGLISPLSGNPRCRARRSRPLPSNHRARIEKSCFSKVWEQALPQGIDQCVRWRTAAVHRRTVHTVLVPLRSAAGARPF